MGFYRELVLPRLQDKVMNNADLREIRARTCSGLTGEVVEIGFGTGLNLPYYPCAVTEVAAVEPSARCLRLAQARIDAAAVRVAPAGSTGEALDLPSEAFDSALSTWTLCTIPDATAALAEVHRVLRPGGRFHFAEHGHASDASVARWQRRIEPVWKRVAGGCHVTRPIPELIERAGFTLEALDTYDLPREPRVFGHTFEGVAVKA